MSERIVTLLHKAISDVTPDTAEKAELHDWIARSPHNRSIFKEVMDEKKLSEEIKELLRDDFDLSYRTILLFLKIGVKID
jgi:hypothetical protein